MRTRITPVYGSRVKPRKKAAKPAGPVDSRPGSAYKGRLAMLYDLGDRRPSVHPSCFVADSAQVIGSIVLEEDASVWFNVVLRGDNDLVTIGRESNVQDGSIIHTDAGLQVRLGRGVTVGHRVMLHGCDVGDYSLVGIGAIVLNRAKIGKHCLIGAGALITEGKEIPDRSLVLGSPGRVVRKVSDNEVLVLEGSAAHYVQNARRYKQELVQRG
jgi:carbonic anhydrase/acetyltransferase-like protein (isoleucine patch superfamily)